MKRLLLSITISLLLILSYALPVLAIDDPDNNPPAINNVLVYEDLAETGDLGCLVEYFIDYTIAGTPTETVTESYLVAFIDTDGTTQLRSVAPYTYIVGGDNGYMTGLAWIYFTAAEVTTLSIEVADVALYKVWLMGNPTLSWAADPPKQTAGISTWYTTGDSNLLLALDVLNYAEDFETAWTTTLDLVSVTSIGNRLTTLGAAYFENVITSLRDIAPTAFADGELSPIISDIDYSTGFGATIADGVGGTFVGASPMTLNAGSTTITVDGLGTLVLTLNSGTYGTATSGTCTVAGSPVDLSPGINTITVGGVVGTIVIAVALETPQGTVDTSTSGTAFDLSSAATAFGMTTAMFSGLVWLLITILICAGAYKIPNFPNKGILIVFDLCIIGGGVLGMMPILVAVLLFIGFIALTGYVLFYRNASF